MDFSFSKEERIYKRNEIRQLFQSGISFHEFPFRVAHFPADSETGGLKVLISVPKKRFKKAVDRNLLKRRVREAYRLNKNPLRSALINQKKGLNLLLIYNCDEKLPFAEIEAKIKLILLRLESIYVQSN